MSKADVTNAASTTSSSAAAPSWLNTYLPSADNALFQGGIGLAIVAAGTQALRTGSNFAVMMLRRHFLTTLEVTSKDRAYPWVMQWLYKHGSKTQHMGVETLVRATSSSQNTSNVSFSFVPGPGHHFFTYKGKFISVQRIREQQMVDLNTGKPWEKLQLMSIGRNTEVFTSILEDALEMATKQEEGKTIVFTNWGSEWRPFGQPRRRRDLDSVVLDQGIAESILSDVLEWTKSASWYNDRGIPYRRGYLLHGPPGGGKTSFIMALAGRLGYNICILNLAERGLTDDRLALALSVVPPQSIVLLEDIDAAFLRRPDHNSNISSSNPNSLLSKVSSASSSASLGNLSSDVTFSGLLNVLDGAAASEERLVFMTTNHIHRLDPALIRPGRVDVVKEIGNASDYQILTLFKKFYADSSDELGEAFLAAIRQQPKDSHNNTNSDSNSNGSSSSSSKRKEISMAALQGHFLRCKNDPLLAISTASSPSSSSSSTNKIHNKEQGREGGGGVTNEESEADLLLLQKQARELRARRGQLTADAIDRMPFNPQYEWDKDIQEIK